MPDYTQNYNLKKPLGNENYNIADQNDNMDLLDDALATKETPADAQSKADAAEANAVAAANTYTDQEVGDLAGTGRTIETVKGNADEIDTHKAETTVAAHKAKNIQMENGNSVEHELTSPEMSPPATEVASVISLPENTVDGQAEVRVRGESINQIVKNGNFTDGTTGWTGVKAILSVADNTMSVTADGVERHAWLVQSSLPLKGATGKKIFIKARARVTNADCMQIRMYSYDGTTIVIAKDINNPVQSQYYNMYGIVTLVSDNNYGVYFYHQYADAATANGKVMEVQEVMAIDMTAEGLDSLTAEEMNARLPYWLQYGMNSTLPTRVKSVGKNLFDGKLEVGSYTWAYGKRYSITDRVRSINYIKVKPNTEYIINKSSAVFLYDKNLNYLGLPNGRGNVYYTSSFLTTNNTAYIRISFSPISGVDLELAAQLEEGTIATPYEPYKESLSYINEELRSLPNGVKDEVDVGEGRLTKKVSDEYILTADDITEMRTEYTNIDYANIPRPFDSVRSIDAGTFNLEGYGEYDGFLFDDVNHIGKITTQAHVNKLWVGFPKGTILEQARTALAGTTLTYQLATPITEQLNTTPLSCFENGTLITESAIQKVFSYSGGIAFDIALESIEKVRRLTTNGFVNVNLTAVTLATDGKSLSITGATDRERYEITGFIRSEESTIPELEYSIPTNLKAQVDSNTDATNRQSVILQDHDLTIKANVAAIDDLTFPDMSPPATEIASVISLPENAVDGQVEVSVRGRTVDNIGKFGQCESTSGWAETGCSGSLDSSNNFEGVNCIKITASDAAGAYYFNVLSLLDTSKYYLITAHVKSGNFTNGMRLYLNCTGGVGYKYTSFVTDLQYVRQGLLLQPSDFNSASAVALAIGFSGAISEYGFIDAIMINEITDSEYAEDINVLMDRYSYIVPGVSSTLPVRVKSVGKNLFDKNNLIYTPNDNRYLTSTGSTIVSTDWYVSNFITVISGETYKISNLTNSTIAHVCFYNNGTLISSITNTSANSSLVIPNGANQLKFSSKANLDIVQLEKGSTATPYEPYKESLCYIDEELKSLPNGVKNEVDVSEGKLFKRTGEIVLDGSEAWIGFNTTTVGNYYMRIVNYAIYQNIFADAWGINDLHYFDTCNSIQDIGLDEFGVGRSTAHNDLYLTFGKDYIDTNYTADLNGLKQYLVDHPVTLTYQLAESETYQLNTTPLPCYEKGTLYVENWKKMILDGSLEWWHIEDYTGYKRMVCNLERAHNVPSGVLDSQTVMTNEGKVLKNYNGIVMEPDTCRLDDFDGGMTRIWITIPDTDSGWGESESPTQAQIKAYFDQHPYALEYQIDPAQTTLPEVEWSVPINLAAGHSSLTEAVARQSIVLQDHDIAILSNALDIIAHEADITNPHAVTTSQIGAETPAGAQAKVDAHAGDSNNPHNVTAAQVGALSNTAHLVNNGAITRSDIPNGDLNDLVNIGLFNGSNLLNKIGSHSWNYILNIPHSSNPTSWRAQLATDFDSNGGSNGLYLRKRSSGVWGPWRKIWDNYNDGHGSGLDADTVKGYVPVNKTGDIMQGILTAKSNTSYTTKQVRNVTISTLDPSGGENGDIWLKY